MYNDHRSYTTSILRRSFRLQTPIFEGGVVPLAGHLTLFPRLRRRLPSPRLADFSTDLRRSIMRSSVLYKLGTTDLRSPPAPLKIRQYGVIDIDYYYYYYYCIWCITELRKSDDCLLVLLLNFWYRPTNSWDCLRDQCSFVSFCLTNKPCYGAAAVRVKNGGCDVSLTMTAHTVKTSHVRGFTPAELHTLVT